MHLGSKRQQHKLRDQIIKKTRAYKGILSRCSLCLSEILCFFTTRDASLLNKKTELVTKCRHEDKFCTASNQRKHHSKLFKKTTSLMIAY